VCIECESMFLTDVVPLLSSLFYIWLIVLSDFCSVDVCVCVCLLSREHSSSSA